MMALRNRNLVLGSGLILLALVDWFALIPMGIKNPGGVDMRIIAPDFWPLVNAASLFGMGAIIAIKGYLTLSDSRKKIIETGFHGESRSPNSISSLTKPVAVMTFLIVYAVSIEWIGIVLASILAFAIPTLLSGERRYRLVIPLSIALPAALYYFFTVVARIPMPLGLFEGLF